MQTQKYFKSDIVEFFGYKSIKGQINLISLAKSTPKYNNYVMDINTQKVCVSTMEYYVYFLFNKCPWDL